MPVAKRVLLGCLALAVCLAQGVSAFGGSVSRVATTGEFRERVRAARPGDLILVAPGVYSGGLSFVGVEGTNDDPIVVRGEDPQNPPVIRGGTNGIRLTNCRNVAIEDMIVEDCGVHGVQVDFSGVWTPGCVAAVSLNRLVIRRIGDLGNEDGIKCTGVWGLRIQDCVIEHWGKSGRSIDLVSCRDVSVSRCVFDGMDHSRIAFQIKGGSVNARVSQCWVKNTLERGYQIGGTTESPYFYPEFAGFEAQNVKLVECCSEGGETGLAFVNSRDCTVERCLFVDPEKWCFRILQENQRSDAFPCGNCLVKNSIFSFDSLKLLNQFDILEGTDPGTFTLMGNVWHDVRGNLRCSGISQFIVQGDIYDINPQITRDRRGKVRADKSHEQMIDEHSTLKGVNQLDLSLFQCIALLGLFFVGVFPAWISALSSRGGQLPTMDGSGIASGSLPIWGAVGFLLGLHWVAQCYPFGPVHRPLASVVEQWQSSSWGALNSGKDEVLAMVLWSSVIGFMAMLGLRTVRSISWFRNVLRFLTILGLMTFFILCDWCSGIWFGAAGVPSKHWASCQMLGLAMAVFLEYLVGPLVVYRLNRRDFAGNAVDVALVVYLFMLAFQWGAPFKIEASPMEIYYKSRSGLIDLDGKRLLRLGFLQACSEVIRTIPLGVLISRWFFATVHSHSIRPTIAVGLFVLALVQVFNFFTPYGSVSVSALMLGLAGVYLGSVFDRWMSLKLSWWRLPARSFWDLGTIAAVCFFSATFLGLLL